MPKAPTWQYYLSNSVDGKKIGWHNYDKDASDKLEVKWQEQVDVGAMLRCGTVPALVPVQSPLSPFSEPRPSRFRCLVGKLFLFLGKPNPRVS